jgi:CheY-like chemotaxis protein
LFKVFEAKGSLATGASLNLHIAYRAARALGGDIRHRNHPNQGNLYEVTLPALTSGIERAQVNGGSGQVIVPFQALYAEHKRRVAPCRILLAEDQPSNRRLVRSILERAGHEVICAEDGDEARRYLETEPFDIAFMDIRMPRMSGIDVMRLTAVRQRAKAIPFIMFTGEASEEIRLRCKALGATAYLVKPVPARRLLDALESVCVHPAPVQHGVDHDEPKKASPQRVFDAMHDMQRYAVELDAAWHAGDVVAMNRYLRAILGVASTIEAPELEGIVRQCVNLPPSELKARGASLPSEIDRAITHTIQRLGDGAA